MKILSAERNLKAKYFQAWLRQMADSLDEYIDQESDGMSDAPQISLTFEEFMSEIDDHRNDSELHDEEFCSLCFYNLVEL